MKRLILLIMVLFGLSSQVNALGFQSLSSGTANGLRAVYFTDLNTGYAVGEYGTIIKTTNAGVNWFPLNTNISYIVHDIYFIDVNTGYASCSVGTMLKTTNAGLNWTVSTPSSNNLFGVYFLNSQTGWTTGFMSTCLKTTNAGVNWFSQTVPFSGENLTEVVFNNNKGFICLGGPSNLLTTTNSGANWIDSKIRGGAISSLDISFVNNFGVTVGYESINNYFVPIIFTTTNNGENWTERVISNKKAVLSAVSVCQSNPNIIFAVGRYYNDPVNSNKGMILYSTNAGQTWLEESWSTDPMSFTGVIVTSNSVYIVGNDGTILKSALPIGITPIGTKVPDKFVLNQNYPNPFNPTTNIEFSIPKNGLVKLSVFDMTGKEVANLVNQVLSTGNYRVDFNASNLSSGTYFYRLQSENYVSTKKMILIK